MKAVTIQLPDTLYAELQEAARAIGERNYGPRLWATDLIASELASRRLRKIDHLGTEPKPNQD